jgi:hypothetical protein
MRHVAALVLLTTSLGISQTKLFQDFESPTYPPSGWAVDFTGTLYWERSLIGAYGQSSGSSLFGFFEAAAGTIQSLITPSFSATTSGDSLSFDHAYATFKTEVDSLIIETSTDGGTSYSRLIALPGGATVGTGMVTAPPSFSSFVPNSTQWASKSYQLPLGTNKIRFVAKSAFGNNLYLDNIKVSALFANDVGVAGIVTPRYFINLPFPQTPRATIKNFGSLNQTTPFSITMRIVGPSGFLYTSTISETLAAGSARDVAFASTFTPTMSGAYSVSCYTQLASDQARSNDTVNATVNAGNYNFGSNGLFGSDLYYFTNSLPGNNAPSQPEFRWRDTTGSTDLIVNGAAVAALTGDPDDGYFTLTGILPGKTFRLFGTNHGDTVFVSTNGIISFRAGYDSFLPSSIPSGATPNAALYPMWMDFDFTDEDVPVNRLSYKVDGDLLIVTYARAPRYNAETSATDYVTFQVQMRFSTAHSVNSFASVQFDSSQTGAAFMSAYNAHTFPHLIGAENGTGTSAVTYRFVSAGAPVTPGPAFGSSLAVTFGPAYQSFVKVNCKAYLEGPYSTTTHTMRTDLRSTMPLTQPYSVSPWSFAGSERVAAIPDSIVDWMLVELRTGTGSATRAARRSAFVKASGAIVDLDATSPLKFDLLSSGSYYVTLYHRNHLTIMSSNALSLGTTTTTHDFSTSQSQAFGSQPMNALETGVFGMVAGDANRSAIITAADANDVFAALNLTGYLFSDVNMSGVVTASDANRIFGNLNRASEVPGLAPTKPKHPAPTDH